MQTFCGRLVSNVPYYYGATVILHSVGNRYSLESRTELTQQQQNLIAEAVNKDLEVAVTGDVERGDSIPYLFVSSMELVP